MKCLLVIQVTTYRKRLVVGVTQEKGQGQKMGYGLGSFAVPLGSEDFCFVFFSVFVFVCCVF